MRVAVLLLSSFVFACGPNASGPGGGDGEGGDSGAGPDAGDEVPDNEFADAAPPEPCEKMDIVFVVDNSGSMSEEQQNLANNFPEFIRVIDEYMTSTGELLDYRVAVTTTGRDVDYTIVPPPPFDDTTIPMSESGENGELLQKCGMPRPWLERGDPDVAGTFSCAAEVGTSGPSLEMPLYTTELAFSDRIDDGTNAGFLREDALLALVVLTDEDDCSRRDNNFEVENDQCDPPGPEHMAVTESLSFLDDLTGARGRWATAVIAGPGPGTCESDFGVAYEATRLQDFVSQAGDNAVFSSICQGDLSSSLEQALQTFDAACESFPPIE